MRYILPLLLFFPLVASAQTLIKFFQGVGALINNFIIPMLIGLAVLFFIYNVIQYFIIQSGNPEGRAVARSYLLWSILAFVLIIALWSIIKFVLLGVGIQNDPCEDEKVDPDYVAGSAPPCSPQPISKPGS